MPKLLSLLIIFSFHLQLSAAGLSQYDKDIIKDYTAVGYFVSNTVQDALYPSITGLPDLMIPTMNPEEGAANLKYVKHLNRALDKLPNFGVPGKSIVYRGIYSAEKEKFEKIYAKGRVWIERRYSSATVSKEIAEAFAAGAYKNEGCGGCDPNVKDAKPEHMILVSILSRTGKDIKAEAADPKEKEVLFKSGTYFKVKNSMRDEKGRLLVNLEELDPKKLTKEESALLAKEESNKFQQVLIEYFDQSMSAYRKHVSEWKLAYQKWKTSGFLEKEDLVFGEE